MFCWSPIWISCLILNSISAQPGITTLIKEIIRIWSLRIRHCIWKAWLAGNSRKKMSQGWRLNNIVNTVVTWIQTIGALRFSPLGRQLAIGARRMSCMRRKGASCCSLNRSKVWRWMRGTNTCVLSSLSLWSHDTYWFCTERWTSSTAFLIPSFWGHLELEMFLLLFWKFPPAYFLPYLSLSILQRHFIDICCRLISSVLLIRCGGLFNGTIPGCCWNRSILQCYD